MPSIEDIYDAYAEATGSILDNEFIYTAYCEAKASMLGRTKAACEAAAPYSGNEDAKISRAVYLSVVSNLFDGIAPGLKGYENDRDSIDKFLEFPQLGEALDVNSCLCYHEQLDLIARFADTGSEVEMAPEYYSIGELLRIVAQATLDRQVAKSLERIALVWYTCMAGYAAARS